MSYTSDLSDKEWNILEALLPKKKLTRPLKWSKRQILDGIFYRNKNGCNWGDLPKDLPPYSTVYWHYKHWRAEGVVDKIMEHLHGQVREAAKKKRNGRA
jgi:transposase